MVSGQRWEPGLIMTTPYGTNRFYFSFSRIDDLPEEAQGELDFRLST